MDALIEDSSNPRIIPTTTHTNHDNINNNNINGNNHIVPSQQSPIINEITPSVPITLPSLIPKHDDSDEHSKTLIHVLRCRHCSFESILRSRFDKHLPCSQEMDNYQLYTCSICSTCSTSQLIMDEHRKVHHPNESKNIIIESIEQFVKESSLSDDEDTLNLSLQNSVNKSTSLTNNLNPQDCVNSTQNSSNPIKSPEVVMQTSINDLHPKGLPKGDSNNTDMMNKSRYASIHPNTEVNNISESLDSSQSFNASNNFYGSIRQMYEFMQNRQQLTDPYVNFHQQQQEHCRHQRQSEQNLHQPTSLSTPSLQPQLQQQYQTSQTIPFNPSDYDTNFLNILNSLTGFPTYHQTSAYPSLQQTPLKLSEMNSNKSESQCQQLIRSSESIQCQICCQLITADHENTTKNSGHNSIENLIKHLTLVHMLPLPVVINYVTAYMTEKAGENNSNTIRNDKASGVKNTTNTTTTVATANSSTPVANNGNSHNNNSRNINSKIHDNSIHHRLADKMNNEQLWNPTYCEQNPLPFLSAVSNKEDRYNQNSTGFEGISSKAMSTGTTHTQESSLPDDLKLWTCPQCSLKFTNFQLFHIHFTQVHNTSDLNLFNFAENLLHSSLQFGNNPLLSPQMILSAMNQSKSVGSFDSRSDKTLTNSLANNNSTFNPFSCEDNPDLRSINSATSSTMRSDILKECNSNCCNNNTNNSNNNIPETFPMNNSTFSQANLAAIAAAAAGYGFPLPQGLSLKPPTTTLSSPTPTSTGMLNSFSSKLFNFPTATDIINSTNSPVDIINTLSNSCENAGINMKNNNNSNNKTPSNLSDKRKFRESLHGYTSNLFEAKRMKFQEQISTTGSIPSSQDQNNAFWKLGQLFPHLPMLSSLWPSSLASIGGAPETYDTSQNQTTDSLEKSQATFPIISSRSNNQIEVDNEINSTLSSRCRGKMNPSYLNNDNNKNKSSGELLTSNNNNTINSSINENNFKWNSLTTSTSIHKSITGLHSSSSSLTNSSTFNKKLDPDRDNVDADDYDECLDSMITTGENERMRNSSSDDIEDNPVKLTTTTTTTSINNNNSTYNPSVDSTHSNNNNNSNSNLSCSTPELQPSSIHVNGAVHNTLRKTRSDMKVIHRYLIQVKHDTREIHQIPSHELDRYIQDFVLTAKKKDGHEYEPESLKAFVHSLERHLKHHDYSHSVLKGNAFAGTRAVLNQRLNELRALSRSGVPTNGAYGSTITGGNKRTSGSGDDITMDSRPTYYSRKNNSNTNGFTSADLLQAGVLGTENPQAILNSLWLMNRTQFNIGGTQRHRNLVWGQFQLVTDENGIKVIKFTPLFESSEVRFCRGYGGTRGGAANHDPMAKAQPLSCTGSAKRQPLPFNCVELFEIYANLRPLEARGVSEPFYLCPDPGWENGCSWFKTNAAGSQLLSRIPRLLGLKPSKEPIQTSALNSNSTNQTHMSNSLINQPKDSENSTLETSSQIISNPPGYRDNHPAQTPYNYFNNSSHPNCSADFIPPSLLNFFPFLFPPTPSATTATPNDSSTALATGGSLPVYQSLFNPSIAFPDVMQSVNSSLFQQSLKHKLMDANAQNNSNLMLTKENNSNSNFPYSLQHFEHESFYKTNLTPCKAPLMDPEEEEARDDEEETSVAIEKEEGETNENVEKLSSHACFSPASAEPDIENLSTLGNSPKMSTAVKVDSVHSPLSEHYASDSHISHHSPMSSSSSSSPSSSSSSADSESFSLKRRSHHHHNDRRKEHSNTGEVAATSSPMRTVKNNNQHHEIPNELHYAPSHYHSPSTSCDKEHQELTPSRLTTSPSSMSSSISPVTTSATTVDSAKSLKLTLCKLERTSYV
ncbi:unnamed protein product [Trichobilharzia szidati]|nr:unnamed protein product [Trichobilharzia szidati]